MNIFNDAKYTNKYVFHTGDLIGIILYIFKENNIEEKEVNNYLMAKYACLLSEKFSEKKIKAEFIITKDEKEEFIKYNKGLYKETEDNGVLLTKDLSVQELSKRYLCMPSKVLNIVLDEEIHSKLIETYNEEKPKVLKKKNK